MTAMQLGMTTDAFIDALAEALTDLQPTRHQKSVLTVGGVAVTARIGRFSVGDRLSSVVVRPTDYGHRARYRSVTFTKPTVAAVAKKVRALIPELAEYAKQLEENCKLVEARRDRLLAAELLVQPLVRFHEQRFGPLTASVSAHEASSSRGNELSYVLTLHDLTEAQLRAALRGVAAVADNVAQNTAAVEAQLADACAAVLDPTPVDDETAE